MKYILSELNNMFQPYSYTNLEYNIGLDNDEKLHIEIAVPGFSKDDIIINLMGKYIQIKGTKPKSDLNYSREYINTNDFEKTFELQNHYLNGDMDASVKNGILEIIITPKESIKKQITIK